MDYATINRLDKAIEYIHDNMKDSPERQEIGTLLAEYRWSLIPPLTSDEIATALTRNPDMTCKLLKQHERGVLNAGMVAEEIRALFGG